MTLPEQGPDANCALVPMMEEDQIQLSLAALLPLLVVVLPTFQSRILHVRRATLEDYGQCPTKKESPTEWEAWQTVVRRRTLDWAPHPHPLSRVVP